MEQLKISVPESINDIQLKDYQEYARRTASPEVTHAEYEQAILQCFYRIGPNQERRMSLTDRADIIQAAKLCLAENPVYYPRFKHKGKEWGMIPNFDKMTFGEGADLSSIKNYREGLHRAMGILYRPITKSRGHLYKIEPYRPQRKYHEELEDMPTGIALGALVFFWSIGKDCLTDIRKSLNRQANSTKHTSESHKNGDGTITFTAFARETLEDLEKLLNARYLRSFYGLPMRATWQLHINKQPHELLQSNYADQRDSRSQRNHDHDHPRRAGQN